MIAAVKVPHIHAEVIKAWADNPSLIIEWRYNDQEWKLCDEVPLWNMLNEYRVKPEPPAKVYPETQMSEETMRTAYDLNFGGPVFGALTRVANAALRHAIDAGQIITMNDHHSALDTLGRSLRDIAITRHTDRDMAVAEAVRDKCRQVAQEQIVTCASWAIGRLDLFAIIDGITP